MPELTEYWQAGSIAPRYWPAGSITHVIGKLEALPHEKTPLAVGRECVVDWESLTKQLEPAKGVDRRMSLQDWNSWDLGLLAVAAYLAVIWLVRLMLRERDRVGRELEEQLAAEQRRLESEKKKAERQKGRAA